MASNTIHVPPEFGLGGGLAFVAEAPSDEELDKLRPLVGPSGRVYNAMLRSANIDRAAVSTLNVFDEKLPDNEVANWCVPAKEATEGGPPMIPKKGYLRPAHWWHLDRLAKELEEIKPQVIVPLGATALWAFTGLSEISAYRGTTLAAKYIAPGVKLLPTFHPAHIMRQWKYYTIGIGDIIKAEQELKRGPEIIRPKRRLILQPTLEEWRSYALSLMGADEITVDIETGWGQITCIGVGPSKDEAMCLPFWDFRRANRSYWQDQVQEIEALLLLKMVLESPVPKLGQNFDGYDAYWLWKRYGIHTMNLRDDTRLVHHALYPELPKSLEFMGSAYGQQGAWKKMRTGADDKRDS